MTDSSTPILDAARSGDGAAVLRALRIRLAELIDADPPAYVVPRLAARLSAVLKEEAERARQASPPAEPEDELTVLRRKAGRP